MLFGMPVNITNGNKSGETAMVLSEPVAIFDTTRGHTCIYVVVEYTGGSLGYEPVEYLARRY